MTSWTTHIVFCRLQRIAKTLKNKKDIKHGLLALWKRAFVQLE